MKREPAIPAAELADLYRAAVRGDVPVSLADPGRTWERAFAGNVPFRIGAWTVTFFNDCRELDYTDSAISPDGRECSDWCEWDQNGGQGIYCPLDLLTDTERDALTTILENAA